MHTLLSTKRSKSPRVRFATAITVGLLTTLPLGLTTADSAPTQPRVLLEGVVNGLGAIVFKLEQAEGESIHIDLTTDFVRYPGYFSHTLYSDARTWLGGLDSHCITHGRGDGVLVEVRTPVYSLRDDGMTRYWDSADADECSALKIDANLGSRGAGTYYLVIVSAEPDIQENRVYDTRFKFSTAGGAASSVTMWRGPSFFHPMRDFQGSAHVEANAATYRLGGAIVNAAPLTETFAGSYAFHAFFTQFTAGAFLLESSGVIRRCAFACTFPLLPPGIYSARPPAAAGVGPIGSDIYWVGASLVFPK